VSYIFGGDTGITYEQLQRDQRENSLSYEQLQRERARAQELARLLTGAPQNVGEGLSYLGAAIASRIAQNRARRTEGSLRDVSNARFGGIVEALTGGATGGGSPTLGVGGSTGGSGSTTASTPNPGFGFTGGMAMPDEPALTFGANPQPATHSPEVSSDPLMQPYGLSAPGADVQPDPLMQPYGDRRQSSCH